MVAPEVLKELQPFVSLAEGLGRAAVQLVEDSGFTDITITYTRWVVQCWHSVPNGQDRPLPPTHVPPLPPASPRRGDLRAVRLADTPPPPSPLPPPSPRGDLLDSRLLRATVIKGILEQISTSKVNIVNADLLAKKRGLRITETVVPSDGESVLSSIELAVGARKSKFSPSLDAQGRISVAGTVKSGVPFLTKIGTTDVDLAIEVGGWWLCAGRVGGLCGFREGWVGAALTHHNWRGSAVSLAIEAGGWVVALGKGAILKERKRGRVRECCHSALLHTSHQNHLPPAPPPLHPPPPSRRVRCCLCASWTSPASSPPSPPSWPSMTSTSPT